MKKAFIFYLVLFLIILTFSMNVGAFDYDLWARLIAGMGVIDGGQVLQQDFLSYSPTHTWWDHEWGSGVIFYFCLKYFGGYSLIFLQAILLFLIFFTASRVIKLRTQTSPYNIVFYIFALLASLYNLNNPIRCHLFSFLLFTVFIYIFEKYRKDGNKLLYLCPLIIVLWNNLHGGVVSGLGLFLIYAAGEFLNKKPFGKYIMLFLISCPLLLINPWGYDYIKFLIMANTMPRPNIVEWHGIFSKIHLYNVMTFKIFMLTTITAEIVLITKKIKEFNNRWFENVDKTKYIIILTTAYLAITHLKLIPFFIIAALCFIYEDIYDLLKNLKLPLWKDKVIYGLLIFISITTLITRDFSNPIGLGRYPVKEVEFIKKNNLKGNILVDFGYGSYVSYKLYPNNLIFMDGRYEEVYYDYMVPLLKDFFLYSNKWDYILKNFPPNIIIIQKGYPIIYKNIQNSGWKLVYEGELFGVFLPYNTPERDYIQPTDDMSYYKTTLFDTSIKF